MCVLVCVYATQMHTLDFNTDTEGVTSTSPFVSDVMALISHFRCAISHTVQYTRCALTQWVQGGCIGLQLHLRALSSRVELVLNVVAKGTLYCCVCPRSEYLSKFVPPPSPTVPSCVGSLVERMAARLLIFYMRHASLVRVVLRMGALTCPKCNVCFDLCTWPVSGH